MQGKSPAVRVNLPAGRRAGRFHQPAGDPSFAEMGAMAANASGGSTPGTASAHRPAGNGIVNGPFCE
jgi:hypothetical protein